LLTKRVPTSPLLWLLFSAPRIPLPSVLHLARLALLLVATRPLPLVIHATAIAAFSSPSLLPAGRHLSEENCVHTCVFFAFSWHNPSLVFSAYVYVLPVWFMPVSVRLTVLVFSRVCQDQFFLLVIYLRGIVQRIFLSACINLLSSTGSLSSKTNWKPK
jgi:hypothetical protein